MEEYISVFALVAVAGASIGVGTVAIGLTWLIISGIRASVSNLDKAVICWLFYDAVTHLTLVSMILGLEQRPSALIAG